MNYVLVCLIGDDATEETAQMAGAFASSYPPSCSFCEKGRPPDFGDVSSALRGGNALVTGHNGKLEGVHSLRAERRGGVWAKTAQVARIFHGARVYVYACNTTGENGVRSLNAMGQEACRLGVKVFAGHSCTVPASGGGDFGGEMEEEDAKRSQKIGERFEHVIHALWREFLGGEDDEETLRNLGLVESGASSGPFFGLVEDSKLSDVINALHVERGPA